MPFHVDLADRTCRKLSPFFVQNANVGELAKANAARPVQPFGSSDDGVSDRLGCTEPFDDTIGADEINPGSLQPRRTGRRGVKERSDAADLMGLKVRKAHDSLHHRRCQEQEVHLVSIDEFHCTFGVEPVHEHDVLVLEQAHEAPGKWRVVEERTSN